MFSYRCPCGEAFHRSHETCSVLPHPVSLTKAERIAKSKMRKSNIEFDPTPEAAFTDIDFLINIGQLDRAFLVLSTIKATLSTTYSALKMSVDE